MGRGEVYLSECFRHVLAAGLIVDDAYFFRVIEALWAEDYQKVATVNMLAACCHSFSVDVLRYWSFLQERGMPMHKPRARPDQVRSWEDWAPWCGVDLVPADYEEDGLSAEVGTTTRPASRGSGSPDAARPPPAWAF